MASWPSPAELADLLGTTITDTSHAQAALSSAKAAVQAEARQDIELVQDDAVVLAGNWTNKLWLPQSPVTAVGPVTIEHGSVFVQDVNLQPDTDYLWDRRGLLTRVSYVTGRLLAPAAGYWGGDQATVKVTYSHGYADIPEWVRQIVLAAASRAYSNPEGVLRQDIQMGSARVMTMYGRTNVTELTDAEKTQLRPFRDLAYRSIAAPSR